MSILYGIVTNGYINNFLSSSELQAEPWTELPHDLLDTRPSLFHRYNISTNSWELLQVDLTMPQWNIVRDQRNQFLKDSDWTQLPDVPLQTKEAWAVYRQQLRDITNQTDPFNIIWPTPPN